MTLEQLKLSIEHNTSLPPVIICQCEDETAEFVFHQYLNAYITNNDLVVTYVPEVKNLFTPSLFSQATLNTLKVFNTKELDIPQLPSQPVWIKCKKISAQTQSVCEDNIVIIPKLEPWHIKDYVYSVCEGLPESELQYLISIHGQNLFRLENELEKILIFNDVAKIYPQLKSQLFTDTSEYGIFDVINAIIKYDKLTLTKLLLNLESIDIDVFGCLKLLLNNFNKIINVQLSKAPNANDLGISDKQFWAIKKYSCGIYTRNQLYEIYKFLTNCDYLIKSGYVPITNMLDYIIVNIMSIKERIV